MNDELTKNVTGWLHTLLSTPGMVNITSDQAENVVMAKKWLEDVNNDRLLVTESEV